MTIDAVEGRVYDGRAYRIGRDKVAEFVAVTGDDSDRWTDSAPPGLAAAMLFAVAPDLLADPLVAGAVVHADQSFHWHAPFQLETDLAVTGRVDRVRRRDGVAFVTFVVSASGATGLVLESRSTFLVGSAAHRLDPVPMAPAMQRGSSLPVATDLPAPRSASRADLIRYASATGDWNPIHWDDATALEAGLGGIVVHGLLQSAWLSQVAATARPDAEHPLRSVRYRYTAPLRPGQQANIEGDLDRDPMVLRLTADDNVTVSAKFETT